MNVRSWLKHHPVAYQIARTGALVVRTPATLYQDAYYRRWLRNQAAGRRETPLKHKPLLSIVVPTYNTPPQFFNEMVQSVRSQSYQNWELILVDDASPDPAVRELIVAVAEVDDRITYKFLEQNQGISGATNEAINVAKGNFISLFDHDDILRPGALYEVARALNEADYDLIYTDEDKITGPRNRRYQPYVKPGWNQDFLYSVNYITHFTTIRKSVLKKVGLEDGSFDGAQDWELFLRVTRNTTPDKICHIPLMLYSWRVHEASTAKKIEVKPYVVTSQRKAVQEALKAAQYPPATVEQDILYPAQWTTTFKAPVRPSITIVAPTSLSADVQVTGSYKQIETIAGDVQNLDPGAIKGDFVIFCDQSIRAQQSDWLDLLLADAQRSDIGFVQAALPKATMLGGLERLLTSEQLELVRHMDHRNVSRHFYATCRYNVAKVQPGVAVIETNKLRQAWKHGSTNDLASLSQALNEKGIRNLYNPYVKV